MVRTVMSLAFAVSLFAAGLVPLADAQSPPAGAHPHMMQGRPMAQTGSPAPARPAPAAAPKASKQSPAADCTPTVRFRLRTELAEGQMAFVGVGGDIEGVVTDPAR
jgi:nitrite reductase (NO-forming)